MKKLLFSFLLLTGCGFTPLYSQNTSCLNDTQITVSPIPNQYGDQMRRILQNELRSQSENPTKQYQLIVESPSFNTGNKTITADEFASTMEASGKAKYYLKNIKTNKKIYSGNVRAVASYAVVKDPYATTVAKNHIQEELSKQLAEQIALDILANISEDEQ